ncbi:MAG: autotransporter domain-containing protein, partial [Chlamydiales bacterium]
LTQNPTTCEGEYLTTKNSLTLLPLYYRNDVHRKHYHLPNYEQNTGGVRLQYATQHPTNFNTQISGSYLHTHTKWADHRGTADSNGAYLDTKLVYRKNDFYCSLGVLGAYAYTSAFHTLFIGYPIKAKANPHYWDAAEAFSVQYSARYSRLAFIPRVTVVQTNIFLSSISEDKPKGLNLQTESKYFGFLDTLASIKLQLERQEQLDCAKAYLDLGWHGITHLSNRTFHSKLDNYTACASSFATQTYTGSIHRFFMEWGATISYYPSFDLLMNYRAEFTKGDFVQAVNFGAQWRF